MKIISWNVRGPVGKLYSQVRYLISEYDPESLFVWKLELIQIGFGRLLKESICQNCKNFRKVSLEGFGYFEKRL